MVSLDCGAVRIQQAVLVSFQRALAGSKDAARVEPLRGYNDGVYLHMDQGLAKGKVDSSISGWVGPCSKQAISCGQRGMCRTVCVRVRRDTGSSVSVVTERRVGRCVCVLTGDAGIG